VEFGYEDLTLDSVLAFRKRWIEGGMAWFNINAKPENWSWRNQMASIPTAFK
jgi:hypothetical protein